MIIEIGHLSLLLALTLSSITLLTSSLGYINRWENFERLTFNLSSVIFVFLLISFSSLVYGFLISDFSLIIVLQNSHTLKPLLYKITGTWGNHEGSLLLWVLLLSFFGALISWFGKHLDNSFKNVAIGVQTSILFLFLCFLIFTSNPFERTDLFFNEGKGLNPILQDPGLAFHPPFLYLGYVGLSVAFSFSVAALIIGKIDSVWARWVRPWTLVAWIFLTIGIALGSWWAYYELGWGGWWFWDPVENASFMPWLTSVALLHSALVTEKRDTLKNWTILLAIIAFSFSLIGTFIVRSGILTSVHSFANDPTRGVWLLFMISLIVGVALVLFSLRASELSKNVTFSLISRESALISNNLLLMVSTVVVFIGTLWPLLIETLIGEKISVGAPFFNKAFTPFMVLLAMILPLGAVLPWRKSFNSNYLIVLLPIFVFSIFVGIIVYEMQQKNNLIAPIGIVLSVWVIFGAWSEFFVKNRIFSTNYSLVLYRILHMRASDWGKIIAHSGFGIIIFGISSITAWEIEDIRVVKIGETYSAGSYKFTLNNVINKNGPNYVSTMGLLDVLDKKNNYITTLKPEKRFFPTQSITTTEAAIDNGLTRDIYVVLGSEQNKSEWVIRTYIKPFVNWIWLGAFILSLGGILSIVDKKLRIGIASRKEHLI